MTTTHPQADDPSPAEFFAEHAGLSYNPATETPEQGQERTGRALAAAEEWAESHGYVVTWEDDEDGDHSYLEQSEFDGYQITTCEQATLFDRDGNVLAALGCIDDATDDYRRVVGAELAVQARAEAALELF